MQGWGKKGYWFYVLLNLSWLSDWMLINKQEVSFKVLDEEQQ